MTLPLAHAARALVALPLIAALLCVVVTSAPALAQSAAPATGAPPAEDTPAGPSAQERSRQRGHGGPMSSTTISIYATGITFYPTWGPSLTTDRSRDRDAQIAYADTHYDNVAHDMAAGGGQHLAALATLFRCSSWVGTRREFSEMAQRELERLLPEQRDPEQLVDRLREAIKAQPLLKANCQSVGYWWP